MDNALQPALGIMHIHAPLESTWGFVANALIRVLAAEAHIS